LADGEVDRRTSAPCVGIAAFLGSHALFGLMLALVAANLLAIGFAIDPVRFPHLVEICSPPLQAGLSELIPIGGAPLALELSAFLRVCVWHLSSRRLLTVPRHSDDSTGRWRAAIDFPAWRRRNGHGENAVDAL
jgi:hypothetical protein